MALRRGGALEVALIGATLALGALSLGALAGCGGSGASSATAGESTAEGSTAGESTVGGSTVGGSTAGGAAGTGRHAIEEPAQSRGIKGESPTAEAATSLRISGGDCARLAAAAERRLGRPLGHDPKPTPPLSACRISGRGVSINLSLDSGFAAHQRYANRMVEAQQFGAPDASKIPHAVAGVGEPGAYAENANWIPSFGSLYAVRGNRWITVNYSVTGQGNRRSREEAADLARLAFRLTAR
jgi:hypothetical protein